MTMQDWILANIRNILDYEVEYTVNHLKHPSEFPLEKDSNEWDDGFYRWISYMETHDDSKLD